MSEPTHPFADDPGEQLVYDTLCDRGYDPAQVEQAIRDGAAGDLWFNYFGPLVDRIARDLGTGIDPPHR